MKRAGSCLFWCVVLAILGVAGIYLIVVPYWHWRGIIP